MEVTTTFATLVTPAPYLRAGLLFRRDDTICGDLQGAYSNVEAPKCTGQTSICTFSGALQGCCDSSGSCNFYSTCDGYYASAPCSGAGCLNCAASAPYCIKYNFYDRSNGDGYDAYGCGVFDVGGTTIYGAVGSVVGGQTFTPTATEPQSATTSRLSHTSTTTPTGGSKSAVAGDSSKPALSTAAIAGIAVGGCALLLIIGFLSWWNCCKGRGSGEKQSKNHLQQNDTYG